jgi:hypothetical protein
MPRKITINHPTWDAGSAVSDGLQKWDEATVQSEYGADKSSVLNPTVEDYYSENDDHDYSKEPVLGSSPRAIAGQGNVAAKRSHRLEDRGRKKSSQAEGPINIGSTSSAWERHRRDTRERPSGPTESQTRHTLENIDGHGLTSLPQPSPRLEPTPERHEENDQDVKLARIGGEKKKTGDTPEFATDVLGNDGWGEFSWGISAGKRKKGKKEKALEVEAGGSNEKEGKKKKKGNTEPDLLNNTPPPLSEPVSKPIQSKLESVPELPETPESRPELVNPRREPTIITINHSTGPEQYSITDEEDSSDVQVSSGSQVDDYTDSEEGEDEEWIISMK